jgi:hypothetical protein
VSRWAREPYGDESWRFEHATASQHLPTSTSLTAPSENVSRQPEAVQRLDGIDLDQLAHG